MTTHEFYVIIFASEVYTLQDNTTIYGQVTTAGELVVKEKYLCSIQVDTNWYWYKHPQHHNITLPTHTILHPQLEVNAIIDFNDIPKSLCNRTQAKNPYQDM